ncbi:hypothetical protein B4U79_07207 [Dinothrombium tinctorium]|uniref:G-protein coupled receptors family 1 profile domain-containing protein n=1 Tax=Dinothrombium tinctorium TaxID=1965070 RepID=A0A3S3SDY2_9ACAR|nr:hypothetical protein B4U79_07207 [Dinothrombium tinctorium]
MESIIVATGITRLILISGVLFVNTISFIRLLWCCAGNVKAKCVHKITTAVTILCSIVYLLSWLPYLTFSLPDGKWPLVNAKEHCIIQLSVTAQVTTILLTVLAVRKLYDCFNPKVAKVLSFSAVFAWVIPQLLYLSLAELLNNESSSFRFLDRLLLIPHSSSNASNEVTIGFMLCIHHLAAPVVAQLSWHYIVLVVPLTALILLSFILQAFRKTTNAGAEENCKCTPDLLISLCLYFNLMWLLILRPLIVLQTLIINKEWQQSPTYLDFGTHLVIIFAAVFVPFASNGGLRNKVREANENSSHRDRVIDYSIYYYTDKDRF